jgi:hypothetical protein
MVIKIGRHLTAIWGFDLDWYERPLAPWLGHSRTSFRSPSPTTTATSTATTTSWGGGRMEERSSAMTTVGGGGS